MVKAQYRLIGRCQGQASMSFLKRVYSKLPADKSRQRLKRRYYAFMGFVSRRILCYDNRALGQSLRRLGLTAGDTVMVHSSFDRFNGFSGTPQDVINTLIEVVGDQGNLLMVSLPFTASSMEYLGTDPLFEVRRTPSKMGLISEVFRRRKDVLRSIHPTHPVLAWGKDAPWIVEGHQDCPYPCGAGSPYDKFRRLKGKVLFFDVPFRTFTFIHYLEDLIKDRLPFPLYVEKPIDARAVDYDGNELVVPVYAFSETTVRNRRPDILERNLRRRRFLKNQRVGNTKMMLLPAEDAVTCVQEMLERGKSFFIPSAT